MTVYAKLAQVLAVSQYLGALYVGGAGWALVAREPILVSVTWLSAVKCTFFWA